MNANPDREHIRRGGDPGRYFYYRPGEVLVIGASREQRAQVETILGEKPSPNRLVDHDDRSRQRWAKRERHGEPFGVWVCSFQERPGHSVEKVIEALKSNKIEAHYNYVSSRTPMRSHAVSYAEPADPERIKPGLALSESMVRVGVLDTGRPLPSGDAEASVLAKNAIDSIFIAHPRPKGPTPGPAPEPDRDTMVADGVLTHPHAGHGLFVASIIARHAPRARILAEATMYEDSIADLFEILVDLDDASEQDCKLLNMSLGFRTHNDQCPRALDLALTQLVKSDVLLVASAGNDGTDRPMWPAADDRVVAVAATDRHGTPTDWSNHGQWVDACAFGNDVDSYYPARSKWFFPNGKAKEFDAGAARWSGTSFAAPLVTALIANKMTNEVNSRAAWNTVKTAGQRVPGYGVRLGPLPPKTS